jgi:hypothetical protein
MDLQQKAANDLTDALLKLHMGVAQATSSDGPAVYVQEHPEAKVYFKRDQLGGLRVEYVFDGRPPRRVDYPVPTAAAATELAQFLVDQIAGRGGGGST